MRTYYINTESVIADGTTPATGFHNIAQLIESEGEMADDMIIEVVENDTPIVEQSLQIICGTFKPYGAEEFTKEMFSSAYKLKSSIQE